MTTVNNYTSSRVDVDCIGVLATTSVLAMAADLGGSLLETVGFSIEFSTSTAWTARMAFSRSVRISV